MWDLSRVPVTLIGELVFTLRMVMIGRRADLMKHQTNPAAVI